MTPDPNAAAPLGWWAIAGDELLDLLRRAHDGENPDLLYAEAYANSTRAADPDEEAR